MHLYQETFIFWYFTVKHNFWSWIIINEKVFKVWLIHACSGSSTPSWWPVSAFVVDFGALEPKDHLQSTKTETRRFLTLSCQTFQPLKQRKSNRNTWGWRFKVEPAWIQPLLMNRCVISSLAGHATVSQHSKPPFIQNLPKQQSSLPKGTLRCFFMWPFPTNVEPLQQLRYSLTLNGLKDSRGLNDTLVTLMLHSYRYRTNIKL